MVRVLGHVWLFATCMFAAEVAAEDAANPHDLASGVDVGYVNVSGYDSWTTGWVGKLRLLTVKSPVKFDPSLVTTTPMPWPIPP